MVIMYGKLEYDIHPEEPHAVATSAGPGDVAVLAAPDDAAGCAVSVETASVRMTFDGGEPSSSYGILLPQGTYFFALGRDIRFVSEQEGQAATVSVLWVRVKLSGQPST